MNGAQTEAIDPTPLVRRTAEEVHARFFEPLDVATLLAAAWDGAAAALARAGVRDILAASRYPSDPGAAYAAHTERFPVLERLASGSIGAAELAAAALRGLLDGCRDGHTHLVAAGKPRRLPSGPRRHVGLVLTDTPPVTVADVVPGGPAQRAGVRRGQVVLTINGHSCASLRRSETMALLDMTEGVANEVVVQAPGASTTTIHLCAELSPRLSNTLLPGPTGPIGLLRIDGFAATDEEMAELRAALTSFEDAGARGWIVDVRWCGGGYSGRFSQMLVDHGLLFARVRHNEARFSDGSVHPMREEITANGTALPFQRPLVILVGPGSISGAESFAGPLQALGRATLVGERTAGLCGMATFVRPAPAWEMIVTARETVFGPDERRFNRLGVPPDRIVSPSPDDEAAGRDPQLEAALDILRG
jgi:carboxyl-terminal processing protease